MPGDRNVWEEWAVVHFPRVRAKKGSDPSAWAPQCHSLLLDCLYQWALVYLLQLDWSSGSQNVILRQSQHQRIYSKCKSRHLPPALWIRNSGVDQAVCMSHHGRWLYPKGELRPTGLNNLCSPPHSLLLNLLGHQVNHRLGSQVLTGRRGIRHHPFLTMLLGTTCSLLHDEHLTIPYRTSVPLMLTQKTCYPLCNHLQFSSFIYQHSVKMLFLNFPISRLTIPKSLSSPWYNKVSSWSCRIPPCQWSRWNEQDCWKHGGKYPRHTWLTQSMGTVAPLPGQ